MVADEDTAIVRELVRAFFKTLNGPDWLALPPCLDDCTTIFLSPSRESGQTRTWPEVETRLKQILICARTGPVRPRLKAEHPRCAIEIKGSTATVSWRARGDDLGPRRVFGQTRAITLAKEDGHWRMRHVQLWSISLRLNASFDGVHHWLDLRPLLAAKELPEHYLSPDLPGGRLWSFV